MVGVDDPRHARNPRSARSLEPDAAMGVDDIRCQVSELSNQCSWPEHRHAAGGLREMERHVSGKRLGERSRKVEREYVHLELAAIRGADKLHENALHSSHRQAVDDVNDTEWPRCGARPAPYCLTGAQPAIPRDRLL